MLHKNTEGIVTYQELRFFGHDNIFDRHTHKSSNVCQCEHNVYIMCTIGQDTQHNVRSGSVVSDNLVVV